MDAEAGWIALPKASFTKQHTQVPCLQVYNTHVEQRDCLESLVWYINQKGMSYAIMTIKVSKMPFFEVDPIF